MEKGVYTIVQCIQTRCAWLREHGRDKKKARPRGLAFLNIFQDAGY